jgi:hypothetical protein
MTAIGSDFVKATAPYGFRCSECDRFIAKGLPCQVSVKDGKVKKRLCASEDCRLEFDARVWSAFAWRNRKLRGRA